MASFSFAFHLAGGFSETMSGVTSASSTFALIALGPMAAPVGDPIVPAMSVPMDLTEFSVTHVPTAEPV